MQHAAVIEAAWAEPIEVLGGFAHEPYAAALLSGGGGASGRWSYLARDPRSVATGNLEKEGGSLLALLRTMSGEPCARDPDGPPFQGGVIGLLGYEFARSVEPVALVERPGWPELVCGLYDAVLAFDHEQGRCFAVGRGFDPDNAREKAETALHWLESEAQAPTVGRLAETFAPETSAADYARAVADVVQRIAAGEIFQANIARAWTGRLAPGASPYELLRRLGVTSPAPFAAYLRLPDRAVVSNSPERFVEVRPDAEGFIAQTRPIKGTWPRGGDPATDASLAAELLASAKDRAENLMIVDLMRNDLSRVCALVSTPELYRLESFANVHHLVSTVEGRVRPGLDGLDVLTAVFPPGSVTGAPKVQAMKVIAAHEAPRGPYCGSMFWAGCDGALDSSVLIRTALLVEEDGGWSVEVRAGAGIVADSVPACEARETEDKVAALAAALLGNRP